MKRKTRQLKHVALESLTLAVEIFNRPSPSARVSGVLLPLQHALEMLFKAIVYERRGSLYAKGATISFSFAQCLGILRSGELVLDEPEAIVAAAIDAHRDGVQHHGAHVREELLYVDLASGMRLFDELLHRAFGERVADHAGFANRMLPIASCPPRELHLLISSDLAHIRDLLQPGRRRGPEAFALLRSYVAGDRAATDPHDVHQPTDSELDAVASRIRSEEDWSGIFPGLARLALVDEDTTYGVRITKDSGAPPARLIGADNPDAALAFGILETDVLKRFPFGIDAIATQVGVNRHSAQAIIYLLAIRDDPKCFRKVTLGKVSQGRYSHESLARVRNALSEKRLDEAKAAYKARPSRSKRVA